MIDEALFDAEEKMEKAVSRAKDDMGSIRTGRPIRRCSTGSSSTTTVRRTPVTQVASITTPEARLVVIKPYEQSSLGDIETAIRNLRPRRQPDQRRQPHPRVDSAAHRGPSQRTHQAGQGQGRDAKVAIRKRAAQSGRRAKAHPEDGEAGEDEVVRAPKRNRQDDRHYVAQVDELVKHKGR